MQEFFYRRGDSVCGPISGKHLRALAAVGEIVPGDFVRKGRDGKWIAAERARRLFPTQQSEDQSDEDAFNAFAIEKAKTFGAAVAVHARTVGLAAIRSIRRASVMARRKSRQRKARNAAEAKLAAARPATPKAAEPDPELILVPAPTASVPAVVALNPILIPTPRVDALTQLRETMTAAIRDANAPPAEKTLLVEHPAMFQNAPVSFLICVALMPLCIGFILLLLWWLAALGTTLTVTNRRTVLRSGLLSKYTAEIRHGDIREFAVGQSFFQRIFGVGSLVVSSASRNDIVVSGIRDPEGIKALINRFR